MSSIRKINETGCAYAAADGTSPAQLAAKTVEATSRLVGAVKIVASATVALRP